MATLTSLLPAPTQLSHDDFERDEIDRASQELRMVSVSQSTAPRYGHRKNWIPRRPQDFGDGGAYPECHVAQYPQDIGKKSAPGSKNIIAKTVDAEGKLKYDAIARAGHGKDKVVYSKFTDLIPKHMTSENDAELERPDDDMVRETTEKTRQALEKVVQSKVSAALPVRHAEKQAPAQYIRYTPSQQGVAFNSGAKQRVIRMVEVQKDPMEPPKFKVNKKIPRGPPSPPAPVMHSPNRKVTVKEQQEWKIPPCISNWKNAKGYTIPLDKRLAADGRGVQSQQINENFAKLAEALYIADRKAREAVEIRAQQEKKLAQKQKEKQEDNLRNLAMKAREERAGIRKGADHDDEAAERDRIRGDRHRDRQRDRNIARAAPDKRSKLQRERERDVSEKIALGLPNAGASRSEDAQYDQRLFNQHKGIDSGFAAGEDESYNVYSEPWRKEHNVNQSLYRPSKNIDKDVYGDDLEALMKSRGQFVPDKEFEGTDRSRRRDGPVQFEKDEEEDPFGLDKFLTEAKKASKRPAEGGRSRDHDYDSRSKKRRE
ncbi:LOW QUALITY PROTEIN: SNW domain-containing protein 1-like [Ptychodera flava]|uniref:LOW QUALITY PROTEIN: SNW domain-containing protein 1-like n=1 Tax=Ptychodera flava TaxID=63121 RepID=UPI003969CE64